MGCVLFVADGKLDGLDVHTYQGSWPETKAEIEIGDVRPLAPLAE